MDDVLSKVVDAQRTPEERDRSERTAKLAEASRVWNDAFNACGGAVGALSKDLPLPFLVETLARARLHDRIALVCDGAELGLVTHVLMSIQSTCGEARASEALRAFGERVSEDRTRQSEARSRVV